ncbi:MAG TPA: amidase [Alphaproteobacteria bacterium]|nr:amidase [Alphaproteobacteria bacterium]
MTLPNELDATAARQAIREGRLRAMDLTEACLERIAVREPVVGAWAWLEPEALRRQAAAADARADKAGPLLGLPVGVKDIIDTADMPTAYGSAAYAGHQPAADAACVALTRRAGGLIAGKTVSTELAYFSPGKTANPRNPAHTPGGSSSGSAAAVADCMVPLAFGTQTAGSVLRPASFCGVVGYKASHMGLPLAGVKALARSLDALGVFARSVADVALMRAALAGAPERPEEIAAPPRIGLCRTYEWERADDCSRRAVEASAEALARHGATVSEVELPPVFAGLVEVQQVVLAFEAARDLAYEYEARRDRLQPAIIGLIERGFALPFADYAEALAQARRARRVLEELFGAVDVLLAPSAPGEAPAGLGSTGDALFNRMWTLLGGPCVSLPGHSGPNGLPVGVQVIGPHGGDDRLLAHAAWMATRLA